MDVLPTEICLKILSELTLDDPGGKALARCVSTGKSTLARASIDPALWKPHYEKRYVHSDALRESERRSRFAVDWRLMYYERRRQDYTSLQHLQVIIETYSSRTRITHGRKIVEFGRDVWDALTLEAARPLPVFFQDEQDIDKVKAGYPLTNLTRRYWASELLSVIARRDAIERWSTFVTFTGDEGGDPSSFEEAFASLSSFYGILPDEVMNEVDRLADMCREHLHREGISYVHGAEDFDTPKLCIAICDFMRSHGFDRVPQDQFYDFRNSFPHLFLNVRRRSLPISLVFVFVAIAKRLGMQATPLNWPNCVIAAVDGVLVNVYGAETQPIIGTLDAAVYTVPSQVALTVALLSRSARNIQVALAHRPENISLLDNGDDYSILQAEYVVSCLLSLFAREAVTGKAVFGFARRLRQSNVLPLDLELVIREKLVPNLGPGLQNLADDFFDEASDDADEYEKQNIASVPSNSRTDPLHGDRLFVGQLVMNKKKDIVCIIGWANDDPNAYSVIHGTSYHIFVERHEELLPIYWTTSEMFRRFLNNAVLGQFFEDAEHFENPGASGVGRGRFIMNSRLKYLYPEEDAYGSQWVRHQE